MDSAAQLSPVPVRDLLEAALAVENIALGSWRVHQVHVRPGIEVVVGYEVTVRGAPTRPDGRWP
ncbi:hypothetical protein NKG05_05665 [Oerskovia sp. M15]